MQVGATRSVTGPPLWRSPEASDPQDPVAEVRGGSCAANRARSEAGGPATSGAQRGARLQSTSGPGDVSDRTSIVYDDDEVLMRSVVESDGKVRQQKRSSGYMSDEQEVQRADYGAVADDNVTRRRPVLRLPSEFVSPAAEYRHQPSSPVSGQLTFSQVQLEDLLHRACAEAVRATRSTGSLSGTELEQGLTSSPGVNGVSTGGIVLPAEFPSGGGVLRRPRSERRSMASVRFRSSSRGAADDEFFDARSRPASRSPSTER